MTTAIYALSADPITYGHVDIINRASTVFDRVIVAIGINPSKHYTFSLGQRRDMAEKCFVNSDGMPHPTIKVMSFSNLLVDFAYEHGANVIIKGVRNAADFDYENILDVVGKSQKVGIDTHVLFADPEYAHVSSTAAKEIAAYNGNLSGYVPLHVKQALEERVGGNYKGQYIIGVTGEIGSGKSHFGNVSKHHIHNIELDHIGHDILCELEEPAYVQIRKTIANVMNDAIVADGDFAHNFILDEYGFINREALGSIVFKDHKKLKVLNKIMEKPIMVRLRQELKGRNGIILINCALLAEAQMLHICNNNVILVTVDKDTQKQRLMERGLTEEQIETRLACQYTQDHKKIAIQNSIEEHRHGKLWEIDNSQNANNDDDQLYKKLIQITDELKGTTHAY